MTPSDADTPPLTAEEEAAQGWALIDQRFLNWHHRTCATHTFKGNRPECDCGLQATLDATRAAPVSWHCVGCTGHDIDGVNHD